MNTEEVKNFLKVPFEKREEVFFVMFPEGKQLKEKLLNIGGNRVAWLPNDSHLPNLVKEGRSFSLDKRKKVKGEVNHCHANTARLFLKMENISIITGYALNGDVWIQHSWGYDGKRVVETTSPFNAYYGVVLSGLDITKFVIGELGDEITTLPREQIIKLPLPQNIEEFI